MGRLLSLFPLALTAVVLGLAAQPAGAAGPTNDPESASQWSLADIRAPEAWPKGKGAGVSVAVVSTGIAKHPDLVTKTDAGVDAVGTDPTADADGRGTHLAGIVGAATGNGEGIAGVAPEARLIPFRAFAADSGVSADRYLDALQRVLQAKPQVVLVDVPETFPVTARDGLRQSLKGLGDAGITVVVGAQNGITLNDLPVVAVAATTTSGAKSAGTAGVADRGLAAPGRGVVSTTVGPSLFPGGAPTYSYDERSGTAQAAAHAAGAIAILRGLGATSNQAADALRATARKSSDASLGAGIIDVAAAVTAFQTPSPAPVPIPTPVPTVVAPGPTNKKATTTPTNKVATGTGVIPRGLNVPTPPTADTPLASDPPEPGEGEAAVVPPGAEQFMDQGDTGGPIDSAPADGSEGRDRPLGSLAIGFGMLFGVGSGLSLTFRHLANRPL